MLDTSVSTTWSNGLVQHVKRLAHHSVMMERTDGRVTGGTGETERLLTILTLLAILGLPTTTLACIYLERCYTQKQLPMHCGLATLYRNIPPSLTGKNLPHQATFIWNFLFLEAELNSDTLGLFLTLFNLFKMLL